MESLTDILTVLIGVVFIYLILSMIVSYLVEVIAGWLNLRGKVLGDAIQLLLNTPKVQLEGKKIVTTVDKEANKILAEFYSHPAIATLAHNGHLPSYISSADFTTALLDILHKAGAQSPLDAIQVQGMTAEEYLRQVEAGLDNMNVPQLRNALMPYLEQVEMLNGTAEQKLEALRASVVDYYNSTMDRASGWYKHNAQQIALTFGLLIALLLNADTVDIFQRLWADASLRQLAGDVAVAYVNNNNLQGGTAVAGASTTTGKNPAPLTSIDDVFTHVQTLQARLPLPLGWRSLVLLNADGSVPDTAASIRLWFFKLIGLIVTTFAISQGSSIWFQALQKLINLRDAGAKPDDSPRTLTQQPAPAATVAISLPTVPASNLATANAFGSPGGTLSSPSFAVSSPPDSLPAPVAMPLPAPEAMPLPAPITEAPPILLPANGETPASDPGGPG